MRAVPFILAAVIFTPTSDLTAQNTPFEASAAAIHDVISGKKCVGDDLLIFGKREPKTSGRYERVGRPPGAYQIGYGTIMILRGQELHSHVATVSVTDHMLFMSAEQVPVRSVKESRGALMDSSATSRLKRTFWPE